MTKNTHHKQTKNHYDFYADLENIKDAVYDATRHARGHASGVLSQSINDVKTKSTDISDTVVDYVTEKPYKALGIALLSGLVLGFWLRR